ncbi:MAG: hypothetical protein GF384_04195, partial [Elusimicrobia bacterium]|nr:hypothetical protein [Elusimicrobiota bacterium]MBD3412070.1 hypothetical protein [Elusimicrobiota bacterium]
MRLEFYQAVIISAMVHSVLLFWTWHITKPVISVPLSVELVKIPAPVKKAVTKKKEPVVSEEKKVVKEKEIDVDEKPKVFT